MSRYLAIIGENWLQTGQDGKSRLDNPADFVRVEIEAALARKIPVIPVLVSRMPMPSVDQLPPTLAELVYRNATHVDPGIDFNVHIERLIQGLDSLFRETNSAIAKTPIESDDLAESSLDEAQKSSQQLNDIILEKTPGNRSQNTGVPTTTTTTGTTNKAGKTAKMEEAVEAVTDNRYAAKHYLISGAREEKEGLQHQVSKGNYLSTFKKPLVAIFLIVIIAGVIVFIVGEHKVADPSNAIAQNSLGLSYKNGKGVAQDYAEAVKWFRKAAD